MLLFGETYHHPNLLYKTGFLAPDPIIYLERDGKGVLYTNVMEFERARKESRVSEVHHFLELPSARQWATAPSQLEGFAGTIKEILQGFGVDNVAVEPAFPAFLADRLREADVAVHPRADLFNTMRRRKRPDEVEKIAQVQAAGLDGLRAAIRLIALSQPDPEGVLRTDGEVLTSERLTAAIEGRLLELGCTTEDTIAAGGPASADPHAHGAGPIRAGQPIVLDIYPYSKANRYWGDLTRTVVKGSIPDDLRRMHAAVLRAQEEGLRLVRPGAKGADIHRAICVLFREAGYASLPAEFSQPASAARFIHGTGHGVGLEIHEPPLIGQSEGQVLEEGDVVTIEPGLYDPAIGGVRIEDLVVVTADGYRNLTPFPKDLRVEALAGD
jgi:Xaa-Pro aminopeptidase